MNQNFEVTSLNYDEVVAESPYLSTPLNQTFSKLSGLEFALDQAAMIVMTDAVGVIHFVNRKFAEVSQYNPEDIVGKSHKILVKDSSYPPEFFQHLWLTLQTGQTWKGELKNQAKDGTDYWVEATIVPVVNEQGQTYQYVGILVDITERKQVEAALRESEARNRILITSIPDLIFRLNSQGTILDYFPPKVEENTETSTEFINQNIDQAFSEDLAYWTRHYLEATLSTGQPQIGEYVIQNNSQWCYCEARYVPCGNNEILVIVRDITERKQMEAALWLSELQERRKATQLEQTIQELKQTQSQLIQAEKMSSLGQLVAGIAHEINNPVNFIYGNLVYTREYVENLLKLLHIYDQCYQEPAPEIQEAAAEFDLDFIRVDLPKIVDSMQLGANRIRELVLSLRNFSRLDEAEMKPVDIHEGIDSTLLLLQHRFKSKGEIPEIKVIKEYGNIPKLECYASQLNQVFMNIIANAIDALESQPAPRIITIKTAQSDQNTGVITITDNGPGIPDAIQRRLFDPFFTTKPIGKGTGLGLSIAHHIVVEKHQGQLQCISAPGQGTQFLISIPLS